MDDLNLTTIIISLGGAALTYLGTKVSNKASIDKSNVENAERIYKQYQDMVGRLESKVEKLEQEIGLIKSKYEKEIAYYQKLVEELEDENDDLRIENEKLRGAV